MTTIPVATDFIVLPDGKFLVLGNKYPQGVPSTPSDIEVYRLHNNGSLDSTFGVNGVTTLDFTVAGNIIWPLI